MKYLTFLFALLLAACTQQEPHSAHIPATDTVAATSGKPADKTVRFLWREDRYDPELKDTFNTIIINEDYCKNISEPERAALGYVATFVGSECQWDGEAKEDFSNLKCKVMTALNLGYQCSETHLGFLRKWFRNDTAVLHSLQDCPQVPFTASSQNTFDSVSLRVKGNNIIVSYGVNGVNMPMEESWSYTKEDVFILKGDELRLAKTTESKIRREKFGEKDEEE